MSQAEEQGQQQGQQQEPRQQVTVNAALDTLCAMFDAVDREVIHMILIEGCGGNMESAVEALLTMTGGVSDQNAQSAPDVKVNGVSAPKAPPSQQEKQSLTNLPADFLRPPSYFLQRHESEHEFDAESAEQRQIIEDEMFAKAIFEDSLFAADLHANPEWVLEELGDSKMKKKQSRINVSNRNKKFSWMNREEAQQTDFDNVDNVDPSDLNARKISFKQRFNTLGSSAKQKLGVLAHKLQRNKQESKHKESGHQYRNVLTSLDDEALIDVDDQGNSAIIEVASEDNRGTYQAPIMPSKPEQRL